MKKFIIIYIFLFASFLHADESLDERKKRIMRKYLREQVIVYNSDIIMENPSDKIAIKDSEKMMIEDQEFLKHDKAVVPKMSSPRITKKMYDQWNLNDDDFNSANDSIEESSKYEYDVTEEIKENKSDQYNPNNLRFNYFSESKNNEPVLPRNNSFLNQKEKANINDSMKNNFNQKNKSFNPYSSFDDNTEEFIRRNESVINNKLRRVDPAQPNTGFDEFRDMYKIK